jgi:hypothetical protein
MDADEDARVELPREIRVRRAHEMLAVVHMDADVIAGGCRCTARWMSPSPPSRSAPRSPGSRTMTCYLPRKRINGCRYRR